MRTEMRIGMLGFVGLFFCLTVSWGALASDLTCGVKGRRPTTLRVDVGRPPESLDPQLIESQPALRVAVNMYATLVQPFKGGYIPGLAKRWTKSKDGLTWTFFLRTSVKTPSGPVPLLWSNGHPFTSADVIRGIRRYANPLTGAPLRFLLSSIKGVSTKTSGQFRMKDVGVEAPNSHTVVFHLVHPTPYFLQIMSVPGAAPLAEGTPLKGNKDQRPVFDFSKPIPFIGAYHLVAWKPHAYIVLCRNPHYWKLQEHVKGHYPTIERLVFKTAGLGDTGFRNFQQTYREWKNNDSHPFTLNGVDITSTVPAAMYRKMLSLKGKTTSGRSLLDAYDPAVVVSYPHPSALYFVDFNLRFPPFKGNRKLRQALSMAMPRQDIVRHVVRGVGNASYNIFPLGLGSFSPSSYPWASAPRARQLKEARRLFHEAGYSRKKPLNLVYSYNTGSQHKAIALALASEFRRVFGEKALHVELRNQEWRTYLHARNSGALKGAFRDTWLADFEDPATYAELYKGGSSQNRTGYNNPAYDRLVAKAERTPVGQGRMKLYAQAECMLKRAYVVAPLFTYRARHMIMPYVKMPAPDKLYDTSRYEFAVLDKVHPRTKAPSWARGHSKAYRARTSCS